MVIPVSQVPVKVTVFVLDLIRFSSTNKAKAVDRVFSIISSPDVKDPCDFDVSQYTTKVQATRAFFDGVEERNLFIALVPLF